MSLRNNYDKMHRGPTPDSGAIIYDAAKQAHLITWGTAVPGDGTAGYLTGSIYQLKTQTPGSPRLYINTGTYLSCLFDEVGAFTNDFGATGILTDVIVESTAGAGVTIEGVHIEDGAVEATALSDFAAGIKTNTVAEHTADAGVTIDSALIKDGKLRGTAPILSDTIAEFSNDTGVTIDGALLKDGQLQGSAPIKANTISEFTGASGVTIDSALIKDGQLQGAAPILCNTISEFTSDTGVTADGVKMKDGDIDMSAASGFDILLPDNQAAAFRVMQGANPAITVSTVDGAEQVLSSFFFAMRNTASVTAAGSTQANSTAITAQINLVSGGDGTKGVTLPTGRTLGELFFIFNNSASNLKVWPGSGQHTANGATNNYIILDTRYMGIFMYLGTDYTGVPGWACVAGSFFTAGA